MPFAAIPTILSIIGGIAPSIISAIAGSKSESEAREILKPEYESMVGRAISAGMGRADAEASVAEEFQRKLQETMGEGAIPGWMEAVLGVAGGGLGYAAGKALTKGGTKLIGKAATAAPDGPFPKLASSPAADVAERGLTAPSAPIRTLDADEIVSPFPRSRRLAAPSREPMTLDADLDAI